MPSDKYAQPERRPAVVTGAVPPPAGIGIAMTGTPFSAPSLRMRQLSRSNCSGAVVETSSVMIGSLDRSPLSVAASASATQSCIA